MHRNPEPRRHFIMDNKTVRILFSLILSAVLVTSCAGVTSFPRPTQTNAPIPLSYATSTPKIAVSSNSGVIEPNNVGRLEILYRWGQGDVYGATLSPDEKTIAVATAIGVYLYDSKTLKQTKFIDMPIVRKTSWDYSPREVVSFSPDGKLLAVAYDGIEIWNLVEDKIETWIDNGVANFNAVQIGFSPQGNSIVVMSMGLYGPCDAWGGNFALYEIKTRVKLYDNYFCPDSTSFHFTFTSNSKVAFVGIPPDLLSTWAYRVSIVDTTTGALIKQLSFKGYIDSLSPDGSKLAVRPFYGSDETEIIDTATQKIVDRMNGIMFFLPENQNHSLLMIGDQWAIVDSHKNNICTFVNVPDLYFGENGSQFNLIGNNLVFWDDIKQNVEIWDLSTCQLDKQLFIPVGDSSLSYSDNGKILSVNNSNYNGQTGKYIRTISEGFSSFPSQFTNLNPSAQEIVTVSVDKPYTISLWDISSGKQIKTIPTGLENIQNVSLSPNETIVAIVNYEGLQLWDLDKGTLLEKISGRFGKIYFNPNGDEFASVEKDSIVFRNTHTGEIKNKILVSQVVSDLVFSNDWSNLAIILLDYHEHIELRNLDGIKLREFAEYPPINPNPDLTVNTNAIYEDAAFSTDKKLLAAIYYDYTSYSIRLWDTETGMILREINVPFRVSLLEFSPDGKNMTSLGDGVIYVWGIKKP
jgi:WD40 repeat protein